MPQAPQPGGHHGDKLVGNPPIIFTGDRSKAEQFITQWQLYEGVNITNTLMHNPYQRAMFFLTYIQGNLVNEWVKGVNAWLRTQVTTQGWATTDERLWNGVIGAFNRQYADVLEQEKAQAELGRGLRMQNGDLDGLITRFEQLVRHANYDVNQPLVSANIHRRIATCNVRIHIQKYATPGLRRMARSVHTTTKSVRTHEESTRAVQSQGGMRRSGTNQLEGQQLQ
jgi:hypothetical protein